MRASKHFRTPKRWKLLALFLSAGGLAYGALWGIRYQALKSLEFALEQGYPKAALPYAEAHENYWVSNERGCLGLAKLYQALSNGEALDRISQKCLFNGVTSLEVVLSYGWAQELLKNQDAALQVYQKVAQNFPESAAGPYRIAALQKNRKNPDAAIASYFEAYSREKGNRDDLMIELLIYLDSQQRWSDAARVSSDLQNFKSTDPGVKLLLARFFEKLNLPELSNIQRKEAESLYSKLSQAQMAGLAQRFPEFFQPQKSDLKKQSK